MERQQEERRKLMQLWQTFIGAKMESSPASTFNLKVFQLVEGSTGPSQLLDSREIEFEEEGRRIFLDHASFK